MSATKHTDLGVFDPGAALTMLFNKASPSLSRAELRWLAVDGSACAEAMALNASTFAEGVASLVHADGDLPAHLAAGNFKHAHDLHTLLLHFANVFKTTAGLVNLSGQAAELLQDGKGGAP